MSLKDRVSRLEKDDSISMDLQWLKSKYFELDEKLRALTSFLNVELKKSNYVAEIKSKGGDT